MRRAHNLDANHRAVVDAFRAAGASVLSLAGVGNGCPDLLVGVGLRDCLVEVKDGAKPPSKRALTKLEAEFLLAWRGRPVALVECPEDAVALVLRLRGERVAAALRAALEVAQ